MIVVSYRGLNGDPGPVLQCEHCIDEQEDDKQKILTSVQRFLDIQQLEQGINEWDVEKQLDELQYMKEKID